MSYQAVGRQLLDDRINVEYVAANLQAGALRATALGLTPNAFNLATWHMWGIQKRETIEYGLSRVPPIFIPGRFGPVGVVRNIPTALNVLGLQSSWNSSMDDDFTYWVGRGYGN